MYIQILSPSTTCKDCKNYCKNVISQLNREQILNGVYIKSVSTSKSVEPWIDFKWCTYTSVLMPTCYMSVVSITAVSLSAKYISGVIFSLGCVYLPRLTRWAARWEGCRVLLGAPGGGCWEWHPQVITPFWQVRNPGQKPKSLHNQFWRLLLS